MKREDGEMIIEASIILPLILILYGVLMMLVLLMYQKIVVSVTVNEAASSIASVYSDPLKDPKYGYIAVEDINTHNYLYREIFGNSLQISNERKAEWYTYYLLEKRRLLKAGKVKVSSEIKKKKNALIQKNLYVTATEEFTVPLVGVFGIDNKVTFSATGCAECDDMISYMNLTKFAWDQIDDLNILNDSKTVKMIQSAIEIIK